MWSFAVVSVVSIKQNYATEITLFSTKAKKSHPSLNISHSHSLSMSLFFTMDFKTGALLKDTVAVGKARGVELN